jgi:hypothetical protein
MMPTAKGKAKQGKVKARRGETRQGEGRQGKARGDKARQTSVDEGGEKIEGGGALGAVFFHDFNFSSAVSFHSKSISFHFRSFVNLFP